MPDPFKGKTYFSSGYVSPMIYIKKSMRSITSSFDDVWEPCIDLPGGHFELKEAMAQRCLTCRCAGTWKICGGEWLVIFAGLIAAEFAFVETKRSFAKSNVGK